MTQPRTSPSRARAEPADEQVPVEGVGVDTPAADRGLPGAASVSVRAMLTGKARPAQVIGVGPYAVYLAICAPGAGPAVGAGRVLAIVAADGIRLPNALVLGKPAACGAFAGIRQGERAIVGAGGVRIGGWAVHVGRWWAPRRTRRPVEPRVLAGQLCELAAVLTGDLVPGAVAHRLDLLAGAVADRDLPLAAARAEGLVGLGPGLTPAGDDALSGLLLALHAFGSANPLWAAQFGRRVATYASGRTTALSATLLGYAAAGKAADQVVDVIDVLAGRRPVQPAADRLAQLGHTSGSCMGAGLAAGTRAVLSWHPVPGSGSGVIDPKERP